MKLERFFIGGEWFKSARGSFITTIDPSTQDAYASVPAGVASDSRAAVRAARWAFDDGPWARMSGTERGAAIQRWRAQLGVRKAQLIDIAIHECGANLKRADPDLVAPALESMSWYAERASRDFDVRLADHPGPPATSALLTRDPLGVVVALCAGAEPLSSIVHLVIPSVLAGNTTVIKAPSTAPSTAFVVAEAAAAADIPPGVINVISGRARDCADELVQSPLVDAIALNGTLGTGRRVGERALAGAKRFVCALGSSGNAVVVDDTELETVIDDLMRVWLRHAGQAWGATCRVITTRPVDVAGALEQAAKNIVAGNAGDPRCDIGPMRNASLRARARSLLDDALARGASASPGAHESNDLVLAPTVLRNVDPGAHIATQEVAAPLIAIIEASSSDDAIRIVNDRHDGVATTVWAGSREKAFAIARMVRSATVRINGAGENPWGGAGGYGRAGVGRPRGFAAFDSFTEAKTIVAPS